MEYINDFFHKKTGVNVFRPKIGMRKDPFYEYLPNESAKDNEVMKCLGKCSTIQQIQ